MILNQTGISGNQLSVSVKIKLKSNKALIPTAMRNVVLKYIKNGHICYAKCVARARDVVFWPHISRDICIYSAKKNSNGNVLLNYQNFNI